MRVTTQRDEIRTVAARFKASYGSNMAAASWNPGWTRQRISDALDALDVETATPDDVNEIIGNRTWVSHECDECGQARETLVHLGEEPEYEARWWAICGDCLSRASDLLAKR